MARTQVRIARPTAGDVVLVAAGGPGALPLDGWLAEALLPGAAVPPRWSGAPAALEGRWDVYASPEAGARWLGPDAVRAILALPQTQPRPWIHVAGDQVEARVDRAPLEAEEVLALIAAAEAVANP